MISFKILREEEGTAAAEMALVTPILLVLMFGSFELGNYFLNEHVVVKAVRDGSRFASRQNFTNFPCTAVGTGLTPGGTVVSDTQSVTRTGQVASGGSPRLTSWTTATKIFVTYDCVSTNSNSDYSGIYASQSYLPRVKVSVTGLQYSSLFSKIGLVNASSLTLNAESQSAVAGI